MKIKEVITISKQSNHGIVPQVLLDVVSNDKITDTHNAKYAGQR